VISSKNNKNFFRISKRKVKYLFDTLLLIYDSFKKGNTITILNRYSVVFFHPANGWHGASEWVSVCVCMSVCMAVCMYVCLTCLLYYNIFSFIVIFPFIFHSLIYFSIQIHTHTHTPNTHKKAYLQQKKPPNSDMQSHEGRSYMQNKALRKSTPNKTNRFCHWNGKWELFIFL